MVLVVGPIVEKLFLRLSLVRSPGYKIPLYRYILSAKDYTGRCGAKRIAYVTVEKQDILVRVRAFKIHFLQKPYISHTYM